MVVDLAAVPVAGVTVLAQDPTPPPGQGPEFGEASPLALVIVLVLGAALIVLLRSMTKHLKRVPASFDEPGEATEGHVTGEQAAVDPPPADHRPAE